MTARSTVSRREFIRLTGAAAGAAALAACAPATPTTGGETTPAPPAAKTVAITMWQHSYPPLNDWTKNQLATFANANPDINVTYELIPFEEYNQKILTALATGQGPHYYESDDYTFAQFMDSQSIAPLDPAAFGLADAAALTAAYEPNALNLVTAEGKIYGLPYDWHAPVVSYNIKILQDAGVDPASLTTWPTTMEAAQAMAQHDANGNLTQAGFCFVHNIDVHYQLQGTTLLNQAGASVLDAEQTAAAINTPEAATAFQLWHDLIFRYQADAPGFTSTFYTNEFGADKVALGWMYAWANSILAPSGYQKGTDFDIILPPTFAGGSDTSISYAWNWVLNARNTADEAVAASQLMDFLSQQGASELQEAGLINPRTGWRDQVTAETLALYNEIFASLAKSQPIRPFVRFNEVWRPVINVFKAAETDANADIAALLAQCEQEINDVLQG